MVLVGGGTDVLALDVGLVVNNPSSSDGVSESRSKPALDDCDSKQGSTISWNGPDRTKSTPALFYGTDRTTDDVMFLEYSNTLGVECE